MKLLHQGNHELRLSHRGKLDFPIHLQNAVELILLTEGRSTALYGNKRFSLGPGDLFVVFPNQLHGFEGSGNARGYVMIIPMHPYLAAYRATLEQTEPAHPLLHRDQWAHTNLEPLLEMACREWKTAHQNLQQGYVLVIMGKLLPLLTLRDHQSSSTDGLQAALRYINDHYREPLTRQEIAGAIGYNESYLSHLFPAALKMTVTQYINSLRIADAQAMLKSTDMTVSRIAVELGFGSIRTFNRIFTREASLPPSAYRASEKY